MTESLKQDNFEKFIPMLRKDDQNATRNDPAYSLIWGEDKSSLTLVTGSFDELKHTKEHGLAQHLDGLLNKGFDEHNITWGSIHEGSYTVIAQSHQLTRSAWKYIDGYKSSPTLLKIRSILTTLDRVLSQLTKQNIDLYDWPPISISEDDGALMIEWVHKHFRIGFTAELVVEESGWYLFSDSTHGKIVASAYLPDDDLYSLVLWLVSFIALRD